MPTLTTVEKATYDAGMTKLAGIEEGATAGGGGGGVIQTIFTDYKVETTLATNVSTPIGLTGTITPTLNTSKVLIHIDIASYANPGTYGIKVLRNGVAIYTSATDYEVSIASNSRARHHWIFEDSPSSTEALVYTVEGRSNANASIIYHVNNNPSSILLQEIGV